MRRGLIPRFTVTVIMWETMATGIGPVLLGQPLKDRLRFRARVEGARVPVVLGPPLKLRVRFQPPAGGARMPVLLGPSLKLRVRFRRPTGGARVPLPCILVARGAQAVRGGGREAGRVSPKGAIEDTVRRWTAKCSCRFGMIRCPDEYLADDGDARLTRTASAGPPSEAAACPYPNTSEWRLELLHGNCDQGDERLAHSPLSTGGYADNSYDDPYYLTLPAIVPHSSHYDQLNAKTTTHRSQHPGKDPVAAGKAESASGCVGRTGTP